MLLEMVSNPRLTVPRFVEDERTFVDEFPKPQKVYNWSAPEKDTCRNLPSFAYLYLQGRRLLSNTQGSIRSIPNHDRTLKIYDHNMGMYTHRPSPVRRTRL